MNEWRKVKIGSIATESKIPDLSPSAERKIRVRLNVNGVEKRPILKEKEGATKYYKRKVGQFIYGRQNFQKGAFGIIPNELDGFSSSSDLPAFDIDKSCLPEWLLYWFKTQNRYEHLIKVAKGVGSQRVSTADFYAVDILLPDLKTQKRIIDIIKLLEIKIKDASDEFFKQKLYIHRLRQSILQDAIEGKLTAEWRKQNPVIKGDPNTDAHALLEQIKAEKQRLITEGKIKISKLQESAIENNLQDLLPPSWLHPCLAEITKQVTDGTHQTPSYTTTGRTFLSAQNVKPFRFMPNNHRCVSENDYQSYIKSAKAELGDLLIGRVGAGIGETAVVDQNLDFAIYVSLGLIKPFKDYISSDYLCIIFNSPYGVNYAKGNISSGGGSAGNFNLGRIRSFLIPLPPLVEQYVIVSKVNQLLAIADSIEKQLLECKDYAQRLMQAVLKEAFTPT